MIELGSKVKDPIVGVEGIVVARTSWLYGCTRVGIQRPVQGDGKVPDLHWVDEPQAEAETIEEAVAKANASTDTGGPTPPPQRNPDPR